MSHVMPFAAHGDTLPVVKAEAKMRGRGEERKCIGAEITVLLTGDACTSVPIFLEGYDVTKLPDRLCFYEHNTKAVERGICMGCLSFLNRLPLFQMRKCVNYGGKALPKQKVLLVLQTLDCI